MTRDAHTNSRRPNRTNRSNDKRTTDRHQSTSRADTAETERNGHFDVADGPQTDHPLIELQRRYGNRSTRQVAERRLRPKLLVGDANDRYEREADEVADTVASGPAGRPTSIPDGRQPSVQRLCDGCRRSLEAGSMPECPECEASLRRVAEHGGTSPSDEADDVELTLRSSSRGRPLPESVRTTFEARFGNDFGDVRVHTGSHADGLNRAIGARAFTYGRDVYFRTGEYRPETPDGEWLLAHELTHTVQHEEGRPVVRGNWIGDAASAVGGALASAGGWVGDKASWAGGKIAGAAEEVLECAKATGISVYKLVTRDFDSLLDLLGIDEPTGDAPGVIGTVLDVLEHPCLEMLPGHSLVAGLISKLRPVEDFLRGAWRVMENPDYVVEQILASFGELVGRVPQRARDIAVDAVTFSTPSEEHLAGITRHLEPKIEYLKENWQNVLKATAWDLLWPWPGVWEDLKLIWGFVESAASNVWDLEFGAAYDDLLGIWRTTNVALGRLYGWFFIGSVLIGTIIGAFFGGAGAIPGAAAGAAVAAKVGLGLLISTIAAEAASIQKASSDLASTEQTEEQREADYEQIANSGLTLAITAIMFGLGAVAARFARGLVSRVAGRVWRRPDRRGRREAGPSRGDVIEVRVLQSERVLGVLRRRSVTWLETIRRNFPVIDLVDGGVIQVIPRAGRAPIYQVNGGRIISVKSTIQVGNAGVNQIRAWVRELAGFTQRQNVRVVNPTGRTLTVAQRGGLTPDEIAGLRTYASQRGVGLQIVSSLPPNHPTVVFIDSIPSILGEAGVVASDEVVDQTGDASREPTAGAQRSPVVE